MTLPLLKSFVVAGTAALAVGSLPAAATGGTRAGHAARPPAHHAAVGDKCLVGTWHDNAAKSSTIWNGKKTPMHYHGGDVDHISSSGVDHDHWNHSKAFVGHVDGSKLTEHIRGENKQTFSASGHGKKATVRIVEKGWTKSSTNKYVYQGKHYTGYLNQTGHNSVRYSCTSKTLTYYNKKGKVTGTETRTSKKP
jgi:hypothetical protein